MKIFSKESIFSVCLCGLVMLLAGCGDSPVDKLASYAPSSTRGLVYFKCSELDQSPLLADLRRIIDPDEVKNIFYGAEVELLVAVTGDGTSYMYFFYCSSAADLDQILVEVDKFMNQIPDIPEENLAAIRAKIQKSVLEDGAEVISLYDEAFIFNLAPNIFIFADADSLADYRAVPADQLGLSQEQTKRLKDGLADAQVYAFGVDDAGSFDFKINITSDKMFMYMDILSPSNMAEVQSVVSLVQMLLGGAAMEYFPDDTDMANKLITAMKVETQGGDTMKITFELDRATLEKLVTVLKPRLEAIQSEITAAALSVGDDKAEDAAQAPVEEAGSTR